MASLDNIITTDWRIPVRSCAMAPQHHLYIASKPTPSKFGSQPRARGLSLCIQDFKGMPYLLCCRVFERGMQAYRRHQRHLPRVLNSACHLQTPDAVTSAAACQACTKDKCEHLGNDYSPTVHASARVQGQQVLSNRRYLHCVAPAMKEDMREEHSREH